MSDIPEDIRAKAFKIADGWSHDDEERDDMQADIARAILSERERALPTGKEAEAEPSRYHFCDDKPIYVKDEDGEWHHIGSGWLAITEAEYASLAHPPTDAVVSEAVVKKLRLFANSYGHSIPEEAREIMRQAAAALSTAIPAGDGMPPGMVERAREIVKANTSLPPDAVTAGLYDDTEAMRCTLAALSQNEGDRK